MKTYIYSLITIFCLTSLSSCEKEIDIKLHPSEPRIVIEATIPEDSLATVMITKTKNYNDNGDYPTISDATVVLSDNEGNVETLILKSPGIYTSTNIKGVQGKKYDLIIDAEGETYTSTSTMPYATKIDTIIIYKIPGFDDSGFPQVHLMDTKGVDNFFRFTLYINGKRMPGIDVLDDEDKDGLPLQRILPFDFKYNNDDEIKKGDAIFVEMQCLDEDAFTYFKTLGNINSSLANPTSNIKGGALGYFSAYTQNDMEIIADWEGK